MKKTTSPYITVRKSKIHNTGVFAKKDIPKGTKIIEYVGDKVTKKESDKRADITLDKAKKNSDNGSVYIFELNKRYDIDGSVSWNTAKWINHSCDPNCDVDIVKGKIWIESIKNIKKGEELSYDYGYDFSAEDVEEHPCRCGSKKCVGYIVSSDQWHKLRKYLDRKKKKVKKKSL